MKIEIWLLLPLYFSNEHNFHLIYYLLYSKYNNTIVFRVYIYLYNYRLRFVNIEMN